MQVATFFYDLSVYFDIFITGIINTWNAKLGVLGLHLETAMGFLITLLALVTFYFFIKVAAQFILPILNL